MAWRDVAVTYDRANPNNSLALRDISSAALDRFFLSLTLLYFYESVSDYILNNKT
jgi:hypothetical protein